MDRRTFLTQLLPAAAATYSYAALAAPAATPALTLTPLADHLTLLSGGGGNVVVFNSPEGVLLVDGGSPEQSARVLAAARTLSGQQGVHTLFNTHWHWDQTGSNKALGAAGTQIIAHENTRLWLSTDADVKWQKRVYPRLPPPARPNKTTYTTDTLAFGGEQIDYGYLPQAHTDGDLYVYFRKANVLVGSDVLSAGRYPIIDYSTGGWIGGLSEATRQLLQLGNEQTKFVAGQGPVLARADVQTEREMLVTVQQRLAKLLAQGMSAQDMVAAAPLRDLDAQWGDPTQFITNAWPGMVARARELGVSIV